MKHKLKNILIRASVMFMGVHLVHYLLYYIGISRQANIDTLTYLGVCFILAILFEVFYSIQKKQSLKQPE